MAALAKRTLLGMGCVVALAGIVLAFHASTLMVWIGTPLMRQVQLCEWIDQKDDLSSLQMHLLLNLVSAEAEDSDTALQAIAVLNAHVDERGHSQAILRHLFYIALTSDDAAHVHMALTGLKHATAEQGDAVILVSRHCLERFDDEGGENTLVISTALSHLVELGCQDARELLSRYTNSSSQYLSYQAREALTRLSEMDRQR